MHQQPTVSRRRFLKTASIVAGTCTLSHHAFAIPAVHQETPSNKGKIFKSVKWGMIRGAEGVLPKFELQKELGFDGMELVSPTQLKASELREASSKTGMPIHGLVNMKHWSNGFRLSEPSEASRNAGRKVLEQCLRDAKAFGGDSVLLVPGRVAGEKENHDHVWARSIEQIRKVLPLASRLGVRILIENVWNGFCEKPELLRDYIDEINSPWVGVYFDIGNVRKFGPSEDWIRVLGNRIVKLDIKDWGKANGFCKIGDGDVDWEEVRKALAEIEFTGWCTAEVGGGDKARQKEIAERMNKVLSL